MATLNRGDLISKLGYVNYFNEKVWGQISSAAGGNIYHGGSSNVTLSNDSNISIKAAPKFSSTAYAGANTNTGSVFLDKPSAIPANTTNGIGTGAAHLKTLSSSRQYFTLNTSDLNSQAESIWTSRGQAAGLSGAALTAYVNEHKNLITADVIYNCCFTIIRKLISIRPFTASWTHTATAAAKKISENFNGGSYAYGVFVDNPSTTSSWLSNNGSGTWGKGGKLSRWQVTLGGNISTLSLSTASISRTGVYANELALASRAASMVSNFWSAWSDRCKAKNSFSYKLFSCHLNCHGACHGNRTRR